MNFWKKLRPGWFDDVDWPRTEDIDFKDDAEFEAAHPRMPKGTPEGGEFAGGAGGGGAYTPSVSQAQLASYAANVPAQVKPIAHAKAQGKVLQKAISEGIKTGQDPQVMAGQIKAYAQNYQHDAYAAYSNQLLRHLEDAYDLPTGSLGKAYQKGKGPGQKEVTEAIATVAEKFPEPPPPPEPTPPPATMAGVKLPEEPAAPEVAGGLPKDPPQSLDDWGEHIHYQAYYGLEEGKDPQDVADDIVKAYHHPQATPTKQNAMYANAMLGHVEKVHGMPEGWLGRIEVPQEAQPPAATGYGTGEPVTPTKEAEVPKPLGQLANSEVAQGIYNMATVSGVTPAQQADMVEKYLAHQVNKGAIWEGSPTHQYGQSVIAHLKQQKAEEPEAKAPFPGFVQVGEVWVPPPFSATTKEMHEAATMAGWKTETKLKQLKSDIDHTDDPAEKEYGQNLIEALGEEAEPEIGETIFTPPEPMTGLQHEIVAIAHDPDLTAERKIHEIYKHYENTNPDFAQAWAKAIKSGNPLPYAEGHAPEVEKAGAPGMEPDAGTVGELLDKYAKGQIPPLEKIKFLGKMALDPQANIHAKTKAKQYISQIAAANPHPEFKEAAATAIAEINQQADILEKLPEPGSSPVLQYMHNIASGAEGVPGGGSVEEYLKGIASDPSAAQGTSEYAAGLLEGLGIPWKQAADPVAAMTPAKYGLEHSSVAEKIHKLATTATALSPAEKVDAIKKYMNAVGITKGSAQEEYAHGLIAKLEGQTAQPPAQPPAHSEMYQPKPSASSMKQKMLYAVSQKEGLWPEDIETLLKKRVQYYLNQGAIKPGGLVHKYAQKLIANANWYAQKYPKPAGAAPQGVPLTPQQTYTSKVPGVEAPTNPTQAAMHTVANGPGNAAKQLAALQQSYKTTVGAENTAHLDKLIAAKLKEVVATVPKPPAQHSSKADAMHAAAIDPSNSTLGSKIAAINAVGESSQSFVQQYKQQLLQHLNGQGPGSSAPPPKPPSNVTQTANAQRLKRGKEYRQNAAKPANAGVPEAKQILPMMDKAWWKTKAPALGRKAVSYFKSSHGADEINSALRDLETTPASPDVQAHIDHMDELFELPEAVITQDVLVKRGETVPQNVIDWWIAGLKAGKPVRPVRKGFTPCSMGSGSFSGNVKWELTVRAGTRAIGSWAADEGYQTENEMTLRHGTAWEVFEIEKVGGQYVVRAHTL